MLVVGSWTLNTVRFTLEERVEAGKKAERKLAICALASIDPNRKTALVCED